MKNLVKIAGLLALGFVATGCAGNAEKKADEAIATANEAKNIALSTQAQFDKYFTRNKYK